MKKTTKNPTGLIGRAKEFRVAAHLIEHNLYVFYPLVDTGVDLVVTSSDSRLFVPLQVRYRQKAVGLSLTKTEAKRFEGRGIFLVYVVGEPPHEDIWYTLCARIGLDTPAYNSM